MPNIQFINLSHPSDATSAECQKTAHSHAARMAHARARRLRNLANQRDEKESRRSQAGENSDGKTERGSTAHNEEAVRQVWVRTILEPSPKSPLSANRADPFGSFAMALNRTEQYLLDHCKLKLPHRSTGNESCYESVALIAPSRRHGPRPVPHQKPLAIWETRHN